MKVLMITQRIDKKNDILGVYHEWAREIASNFEKFSVICLYEGKNELPESINVMSLGKELGVGLRGFQRGLMRMKYLWRFYKYIYRERENYDVVFVHMNPIYVLLGWPVWRPLSKKIFLFYAHYRVGMLLRLSALFCKNILTSVRGSCGLKSAKVLAIGQGIDTRRFLKNAKGQKEENSILFVGRISKVKNLDILIDALGHLKKGGKTVRLAVVGGKDYGEDDYYSYIRRKVDECKLEKIVVFEGEVQNSNMSEIYNKYEIVVNLTQTGSFDKTILEAMSCECLPIVSNELYYNIFPRDLRDTLMFKGGDSRDLASKIYAAIRLSSSDKAKIGNSMREIVVRDHSLDTLGKRLHTIFLKS
jgi:glycosyltransferase involved in cell wall biosynthesis